MNVANLVLIPISDFANNYFSMFEMDLNYYIFL